MPTLHHQNTEQNVPFAPATHAAPILTDEPQQMADAQIAYAKPETMTRNWLRRYEITWTGLLSNVKWSDIFIVAVVGLIMTGICAAGRAMLGRPFSLMPTLFSSVLLIAVVLLKERHQAKFTGHRPLSWIISWLFRATLWFAFFALLRVNLAVLEELVAASIVATGSIVWQYWHQSHRDTKTH